MIRKKKGVSPVIATVLLITMVVVIGLIIFLWFRGLTKESITKFGGTNIELVCNDVTFEVSYTGGVLSIINNGNVPIYSMNIKLVKEGNHETKELKTLSDAWPPAGLNSGGVFSAPVTFDANEIVVIPILVGTSKSGKGTHTCSESLQGIKIDIV